MLLSALSSEMLRGILQLYFLFLVLRGADENSDKESGHQFFFLFFPFCTDSLSTRRWFRLEKLEIIDFVCWFWRYGSSWHPSNHEPSERVRGARTNPSRIGCQDFLGSTGSSLKASLLHRLIELSERSREFLELLTSRRNFIYQRFNFVKLQSLTENSNLR